LLGDKTVLDLGELVISGKISLRDFLAFDQERRGNQIFFGLLIGVKSSCIF